MKPLSQENAKANTGSRFNKIVYAAFLLLSAYYLFAGRDLSNASMTLGIALAFDPFDQKISWGKRPFYQRVWLLVHLTAVFIAFGLMITVR